ncbi:uncharacterized protein LOC127396142 [Apus apus]|uniref:uncharacterized protein LOC127396142 n=1 Tax=Apus apus TaxID=8895 RepID=UPI0021F84617|nr:uncharacterized protein LOC127396142 [Apus apus]
MSLWCPPHGAHVFTVALSSWYPSPHACHVLVVLMSSPYHILMVPTPSHVPISVSSQTGLSGAGKDHPHRDEMSPRVVALQAECAEPPAPCCQPAGASLGPRAAEEEEGAVSSCLTHLATTSPGQIQPNPFPGWWEGRRSSSGTVQTSQRGHGCGDGGWAALWDMLGTFQQDKGDIGFQLGLELARSSSAVGSLGAGAGIPGWRLPREVSTPSGFSRETSVKPSSPRAWWTQIPSPCLVVNGQLGIMLIVVEVEQISRVLPCLAGPEGHQQHPDATEDAKESKLPVPLCLTWVQTSGWLSRVPPSPPHHSDTIVLVLIESWNGLGWKGP